MSTKNLSTVTTDLIETYGNTAKNVINAYRVGNERVIGMMDQRWESAVEPTRSQNITVTCRRSASCPAGALAVLTGGAAVPANAAIALRSLLRCPRGMPRACRSRSVNAGRIPESMALTLKTSA